MKRREILAAVPAVGTSLMPSLICPACWAAYASLLSAVGLSFLAESKYLLLLNAVALVIALVVLARRVGTGSNLPLVLGMVASAAIVVGKFGVKSNILTWLGAAALTTAFVWTGPRSRPAPTCPQCTTKSLEVSRNGNPES